MSSITAGGDPPRTRVRKRVPHACNFCKRQKIRCSGSQPCNHCEKRRLTCVFVDKEQTVLVSKETLATLERDALQARHGGEASSLGPRSSAFVEGARADCVDNLAIHSEAAQRANITGHSSPRSNSSQNVTQPLDLEYNDSGAVSVHNEADHRFTNPLVSGLSSYTAVPARQALLLGSSSNWSFGRRALVLAHNRVFASPLPDADLHFDGSTYELGWDGRRTTAVLDQPALPTADHALFLINTAKFHCGQLFHIFDNDIFMHHFGEFHNGPERRDRYPELWYIHYLIILAIGKSLIGRLPKGRKPSGADLFVHAMQLLPDQTFLWTDALQSTEILCCAALYLQCLDLRIVAYNIIGQAMRTAIAFGFHTDMPTDQHTPAVIERCRKVWWTIYMLDSHMSALLGAPRSIRERDISARLPTYDGSAHRTQALHIHVKLANIEGLIQQTVYSKEGRTGDNFLESMKTALKALADINDERTSSFPLVLEGPESGISRLSAHLHLFHHQCIILNTKPLLFSFFQKRVETAESFRIPSSGGVRSLLRVCVGSAHQATKILAALQRQTLLDAFVPFDLESTWSAALVLLILPSVDPSLSQDTESSLHIAYDILEEMALVGNIVAAYRKAELAQLEKTLKALEAMSGTDSYSAMNNNDAQIAQVLDTDQANSTQPDIDYMSAYSFDVQEVLSSQQLEAVANSMNMNGLDWSWAASSIEQLDPSLL